MKNIQSDKSIDNNQHITLDDSSLKKCVLKEYRILPETINIVCQIDFENFDKWIRDIFYGIKLYPKIIDPNYRLLEILEQLSLLMAYEQRSESLSQDSLEKLAREATVDVLSKDKINKFLFKKDNYISGKNIHEVHERIDKILKYSLRSEDYIDVFSRIKNYKSIINKCKNILKKDNPSLISSEIDADYIIKTIGTIGEKITITHSDYLDDIIGYNVIIDDSSLTPHEAYIKMSRCMSTVATTFLNSGFKIKQIQKDFRGKQGVTSFSIYIFDELIHNVLGNLPIRIYFQLKSVMYNSHSMFYVYKISGQWRQPPWLSGIDFNIMHSHRECRHAIFDNFKIYFQKLQNSQFYLENYLNIIDNNPAIKYFSKLPLYSKGSIIPKGYSSSLQNNYDNFNELVGSRFSSRRILNIAEFNCQDNTLLDGLSYLLMSAGYKVNCKNTNFAPKSQNIIVAKIIDLKSEESIDEIFKCIKSNGIIMILPNQNNKFETSNTKLKSSVLLHKITKNNLDYVCVELPEINNIFQNNLTDTKNDLKIMIIAK